MECLEERTMQSASLLADINAGTGSSLPENFNVVGNNVLFLAYGQTRGQMLWETNGTSAGTSLVKDINPNPQNGMYQGAGGDSIVIGNEMYFAGVSGAEGVQLWETDGTASGTQMVADLNPGGGSSSPGGFTNFNGKLAFAALGQLWITNGTSAGTISLGDFNPTGVSGTTDRMAVLGNDLYFMRYNAADSDGQSTGELWKTDGTLAGTQMVTDVSPGNDGDESVNSEPSDLININGKLYFAADDGVHGWALWKSDGTAVGTSMVDDLAPPPAAGSPEDGSYPSNLTDFDGQLYFTAAADYSSPELYTLNATTGVPAAVDPIADNGPSDPQQLVVAGAGLFFTSETSSGATTLWHSNGTAAGTSPIATINPDGEANITAMTAVGSSLFFTADDGVHGAELWTSDGTSVGTLLAADIQPGSEGSSPGPVTVFQGNLIFSASVDADGEEPFAYALPTPAAPVVSLASPASSATPVITGTAPAGSTVYLLADGVAVGTTVAGSNGEFRVGSSITLSAGTHSLSVSDAVNGVSSAATPIIVTVSASKPPAPEVFAKLISATNSSILLRFSANVSASLARTDLVLTNLATGNQITRADIFVSYNLKNNIATITFKHLSANGLGTGHYLLRIDGSKVTDTAGGNMGGDRSFVLTIRKK
jgi:ELWxxDGT repeat protein